MLKDLQSAMLKEEYDDERLVLYRRMKAMTTDFAIKKEENREFHKNYNLSLVEQKSYIKSEAIKSEPASKKAKVVTAVKKSVFSGTTLDKNFVPKANSAFTTPVPSLENYIANDCAVEV